jgi:hypothetical protein
MDSNEILDDTGTNSSMSFSRDHLPEDSEYEYPPMSVNGAESDSAPPTLNLGDTERSDVEDDDAYEPPEASSEEDASVSMDDEREGGATQSKVSNVQRYIILRVLTNGQPNG